MNAMNSPEVNEAVVEKAIRHINHHGGVTEKWFVGIEEAGSDRNADTNRHAIRYELSSDDEAKLTMSSLLGLGLQADDEYGSEPTILFIYTEKPTKA